jgi:LPS export ABC transporter protein LptC
MRKRLRFSIAVTTALLLAGVGFLVAHSIRQQHTRELVQQGLEFIPGVSQHMTDFHRVKVQDGRKVWEVSAQDAQYFQEDKVVVVRGATMQLFLKDGRMVGLSGAEGRILLDGRDVTRVELSGDIQVSLADYVVRTQRAAYDHAQQRISAPGSVEISGQALHLEGDGMEADVETQRVRLLHHVTMQVQPALLKQGGSDAPP